MLKVNNKDTRTTPLAYFTPCSSVSIVNFKHVIAGWEVSWFYTCGTNAQVSRINFRLHVSNLLDLEDGECQCLRKYVFDKVCILIMYPSKGTDHLLS